MDCFQTSIRSVKLRNQPFKGNISGHPVKLKYVQAKFNRFETAIEVSRPQLMTTSLIAAAVGASHDQNCSLIDSEAQKRQDTEAVLLEVCRCLTNHLSLIRRSQYML